MGKFKGLYISLGIILILSACSNNQINVDTPFSDSSEEVITYKKEYVDYYNDYSKYIEETESAIDTAKKSYDVLEYLKNNPDYNINGLDEKARNMLNKALEHAFKNYRLTSEEVNEIRYMVLNNNVIDSVKKQYSNLVSYGTNDREYLIKIRTTSPKNVYIGMTTEEVLLDGWGSPIDINRTTTANEVREQWVYPNYNYLYFENGILTTIQN